MKVISQVVSLINVARYTSFPLVAAQFIFTLIIRTLLARTSGRIFDRNNINDQLQRDQPRDARILSSVLNLMNYAGEPHYNDPGALSSRHVGTLFRSILLAAKGRQKLDDTVSCIKLKSSSVTAACFFVCRAIVKRENSNERLI